MDNQRCAPDAFSLVVCRTTFHQHSASVQCQPRVQCLDDCGTSIASELLQVHKQDVKESSFHVPLRCVIPVAAVLSPLVPREKEGPRSLSMCVPAAYRPYAHKCTEGASTHQRLCTSPEGVVVNCPDTWRLKLREVSCRRGLTVTASIAGELLSCALHEHASPTPATDPWHHPSRPSKSSRWVGTLPQVTVPAVPAFAAVLLRSVTAHGAQLCVPHALHVLDISATGMLWVVRKREERERTTTEKED